METPKLSQQHRKLEKLAGIWSGEETLSPSPPSLDDSTVEAATGTVTAKLDLDGFFLIVDYTSTRKENGAFRGHGICGWDPSKRHYTLHWFDSTGRHYAAPALGTWEKNVLTFHSKTPTGRYSRYEFTFSDEDQCTIRIDITTDGVMWKPFLEQKLRRITAELP